MILNDFRCETGTVFERLVKSDETTVRCNCGKEAHKVITPVRFKLEGISGHFPTASDKWAKMHEQKTAEERKRNSA